jgi:hypothetical protein
MASSLLYQHCAAWSSRESQGARRPWLDPAGFFSASSGSLALRQSIRNHDQEGADGSEEQRRKPPSQSATTFGFSQTRVDQSKCKPTDGEFLRWLLDCHGGRIVDRPRESWNQKLAESNRAHL